MSETHVIPLCIPNLSGQESKWVTEALATGFVSTAGPLIEEFETAFASYVGSRYAVACSSGTTAIHTALHVLGMGPGKEVATADFTFVASANPAIHLGASVSLVDSSRNDWCMDPSLLEDWLRKRARVGKLPDVLMPVHVLGQPADMNEIMRLASEFEIPVVEDAAESLGATVTSGGSCRQVGTFGEFGCFSFNGNKIMTTGGGGILVTDSEDLARKAKHLVNQAKVDAPGYLHDQAGYNYRMTNLVAALGLAQLERLNDFIEAKRSIADRYNTAFANLPVCLPPETAASYSTYWLYSLLCENELVRDDLVNRLNADKIQARLLWRPLHMQPYLTDAETVGGSISAELFSRGVSLPCSTQLTHQEQNRVIDTVKAFYQD